MNHSALFLLLALVLAAGAVMAVVSPEDPDTGAQPSIHTAAGSEPFSPDRMNGPDTGNGCMKN